MAPTATATPTIAIPPSPTPVIYTVQRGDTLGALALHFGVSVQQLMSANGITDEKSLKVGQQLVIPVVAGTIEAMAVVAEAPASATAGPGAAELSGSGGQNVIYYVKVGETLSVIANLHGVQLKDLLMANGLAPDSQLVAGDKLLIPRGPYTPVPTVTPLIPTETPTPEPTARGPGIAAQAATATPEPPATQAPTPVVYEVQRGDVPAAIAQKHGVSVEALLAANPGVSPMALRPGDKLVIPGTAAAAPTATPVLASPTPDRTVFTDHTITAGEAITDIFVRYNVTYAQLIAYNTITDSNSLVVGSVLRIPLGTPTPTATPIPSPTVTPTPLPAYVPPQPLMPLDGAELALPGAPVVLNWAATGLLGSDEYYVVRLRTFDTDGLLVRETESWTQTTSWRVPEELLPVAPGRYRLHWDVTVERRLPGATKPPGKGAAPPPAAGLALSDPSPVVEFYLTISAR